MRFLTRHLLFIRVAALITVGGITAPATMADTVLFTNAVWRVEGVADPLVQPMTFGSIAISVNHSNLGNFTTLKVYHTTITNGTSQVFTIGGTGILQPILPGGAAGAEARLTSYWPCNAAGYVDLGITALAIQTKKKGKETQLQMQGGLSDFTAVAGRKLKLIFAEPTADLTTVSVDYSLYATNALCLDQAKQDAAEGFLVARLTGSYRDTTNRTSDVARYNGITAPAVDYYYYTRARRTKDLCADLTFQETRLFAPDSGRFLRFANPGLFLVDNDINPSSAPTVRVRFNKPKPSQLRGQGISSTNSLYEGTYRNVEVWGSWNKAKDKYKPRQRLYRMRFDVDALPPGPRHCD